MDISAKAGLLDVVVVMRKPLSSSRYLLINTLQATTQDPSSFLNNTGPCVIVLN